MKFLIAIALCVAAANALDVCQLCENVLTPVLEKATPADREKVVGVLKSLCFGNAACEAKVDSLSGEITSGTPQTLCAAVDLCQKQAKRGLFDVCSICEEGVDKIKAHLSNETAEEIKDKLEYLCFGNAACKAKIDSVVDNIAQATSQEICSDLHLCSSYKMFTFTGGRFCNLCEKFAAKFLDKINNETLSQLENYLDAACRGNQQCLDAVEKMITDLADLTPESVCQQLHLCAGAGQFVADVSAPNKCAACTQKLDDVIKADMAKISAGLKKMCHGNTQCNSYVDHFAQVVQNNREKTVTDLCKVAQQC